MDKLPCERASKFEEKNESEWLRCCACDYATQDKDCLEEHLLDHYAPRKIKCDKCSFMSRTQKMLDLHMRDHSNYRNKIRCNDCSYITNSYHRLLAHVKKGCRGIQDQKVDDDYEEGTSTGRKQKDYRYRGKVRASGSYYRQSRAHLYFNPYLAAATASSANECVNNKKTFPCAECGYPAASEERLESHRRVHDSFKPYECEKCSYMGFFKSEFNDHVKSHIEASRFRCGDCDYATNNHHALKLHLRRNKHFSEMLPIADDSSVREENVSQPPEDNEIEIIEI